MSSTDGSSDEMPMLITAVGDDAAGNRLIQHCKDAGVRVEHVTVRLLYSTTLCILTVLS
jgi:sugar/nucleoside kinase (ribokinase family)